MFTATRKNKYENLKTHSAYQHLLNEKVIFNSTTMNVKIEKETNKNGLEEIFEFENFSDVNQEFYYKIFMFYQKAPI